MGLGDSSLWGGEVVDVTYDCVTYPVAHCWLSFAGMHRCYPSIPVEYFRRQTKMHTTHGFHDKNGKEVPS